MSALLTACATRSTLHIPPEIIHQIITHSLNYAWMSMTHSPDALAFRAQTLSLLLLNRSSHDWVIREIAGKNVKQDVAEVLEFLRTEVERERREVMDEINSERREAKCVGEERARGLFLRRVEGVRGEWGVLKAWLGELVEREERKRENN